MRTRRKGFWRDQSGAIGVMAAIIITLCVGVATLVVDLAHLYVVKNELQRVADASALAGARGLWPNVLPVVLSPPYIPEYYTGEDRARNTATSPNNKVDGRVLGGDEVTVEAGNWNYITKVFTPIKDTTTNGVRVQVRRMGVTNLFGRILRSEALNLTATAIAVMDGAKSVGKGTLPIAINKDFVVPGQPLLINFTPDPLDTGGWFTDPPDPASARTLKDYIKDDSCPPLYINDIINLQNGQDTSVFHLLHQELLNHQNAGVPWDVYLPVVDTDRFVQSEPIVAFCPFRITQVDQGVGISGTIFGLGEAKGAEPGGPNKGVLAPPKLVF